MRYRDIIYPILVAAAFTFIGINLAMGDDSPPQTEVRICDGTLPATSLLSNHDASCYDYTINAVEAQAGDILNHNDDDTYRHVYFHDGDPACIFTARVHYTNPDDPSWARHRYLTEVSGGRECNASTPNGQCAYISSGYAILGVTGQSCSQAGIPSCTGPFCI